MRLCAMLYESGRPHPHSAHRWVPVLAALNSSQQAVTGPIFSGFADEGLVHYDRRQDSRRSISIVGSAKLCN